jgi:hypothetical protein
MACTGTANRSRFWFVFADGMITQVLGEGPHRNLMRQDLHLKFVTGDGIHGLLGDPLVVREQ